MKMMVLKTKIVKYVAGLALALTVTACASTQNVTKSSVISSTPQRIEITEPAYKVHKLSVTVSDELTVSEANLFFPIADIVWREDVLGNRKQQVQSILVDAIASGVSKVETGRPVTMEVNLHKFHSLSEKAR